MKINLLKDKSYIELMDLTAKAQKVGISDMVDMSDIVGVSNVSVNLAKKHLLDDLLLDVKKIHVDKASLVKIKIWLESHKKQLEVE